MVARVRPSVVLGTAAAPRLSPAKDLDIIEAVAASLYVDLGGYLCRPPTRTGRVGCLHRPG